jgi:predicted nucleic acid-binding protein
VRAVSDTEHLVDTDVLVDHLRARSRLTTGRGFAYSVISRFELFAGHPADVAAVNDLLDLHVEVPVDRAIAERAGAIRRDVRLEVADSLIAATALVHDLELVTRNRKDFERVRGLRMRDPGSLT